MTSPPSPPPRAFLAPRPRGALLAAAALAAVGVAAVCAALRLFGADYPSWWVPGIAAAVLLAAGAAAGSSAAVRRRAEQVLLVSADVATFAVVAVGALVAAVLALGRMPDRDADNFLGPVLAAAAAAALLIVAIRLPGRRAVRRALRGSRYAADEALRAFSEQVSRGNPLTESLTRLADTLRRDLALRRVEIWTGGAGRMVAAVVLPEPPPSHPLGDQDSGAGDAQPATAAAAGGEGSASGRAVGGLGRARPGSWLQLTPSDLEALARTRVAGPGWLSLWVPRLEWAPEGVEVRVVPARAGGDLLGLLVVERPPDAPRFAEAEDRLLAEIGTRLGTVLHNHQLDANLREALDDVRQANEELRVSRARLVAAADAERRRIERDLHDGAQQQLVSLAVGLRLVRDLVREEPEAAEELIGEMAEQVNAAIAEVRNLAHGIYPPLLRSGGLTEALRAAGARSPLGVTVVADDIGRHGPDIEAAVYFCCLEALQNAAKHAPGAQVRIELVERKNALEFTVADDGPGFDPARPAGHGLTNMRDRIGAIGGSIRFETAPGQGVRVIGVVPTGPSTLAPSAKQPAPATLAATAAHAAAAGEPGEG
ncbi:MAG: GAF domain-containing sensor histidine kinase [Frankia sp.]|nr:GAF domain-containing sensor histidine kinase [Frankia sp.]